MTKIRGMCVGAGYFSPFHFDAWQRIDDVEIVAICDLDREKAARAANEFGVNRHGENIGDLLDDLSPDFVDVITPPHTHVPLVEALSQRGVHILCQKPLAPTMDDAIRIVRAAEAGRVRLMIHENFRFQPWHREIKRLIASGTIGHRLHSLLFRCRTGDGWQDDAYLDRQPYFRDMERLLVYETGVHFIDTFRYLGGDIDGVYAVLKRFNPGIRGEDAALLIFEFTSGATGIWDANRFNECNYEDPRLTFGEFLVEGCGGSIRLYLDGRLTVQPLGRPERDHDYFFEPRNFSGDCVFFTLRHFVDCMLSNKPFETEGADYLKTLIVQEATYRSAKERQPVRGLLAKAADLLVPEKREG